MAVEDAQPWRVRAVIAATVILLWLAGVTIWAFAPMSDEVPTGLVDDAPTTQTVKCHAPISRDGEVRGTLPDLDEPRSYQREPCAEIVREAWNLFVLDLVVGAVALLLCARLAASTNPFQRRGAGAVPEAAA